MRPAVGIGVIVGLVAVGAFATSAGHEFVYDDVHIIVGNTQLHSVRNFASIVTDSWWPDALYRPVTQLSLALDWSVSNGDPRYFHLVNVFLHAVTSVLVLVLCGTVLPRVGAVAAALIFAVHPVHVEAVSYVVGRADVMATLFVVSAALLYRIDGSLAVRATTNLIRWLTSFGVLACLLLAFGSKESALGAPALLLVVDWVEARRSGVAVTSRVRSHATLLIATFVVAAEWMLLRSLILGDFAGDHPGPGVFTLGFVDRVTVMTPVVFEWARLLLFPLHLSADYSPNFLSGEPELSLKLLLGVVILLLAFIGGVRASRRFPEVTFGLLWMGGSLLVISNVLVPSGVLLAERSMYLPSVGFVIVVGWLVTQASARRLRASVAVVALVVGAGLARSLHRIPVWKNASVFFPQLVRDAPGSFRGIWVAGALAYDAGDRERGEQLMRQAIGTYPLFSNAWSDLASYFEQDERWLEAGQFYAASFRIDPTRLDDAVNSVSNFIRASEPDSAELVANAAVDLHGRDHRIVVLLAEIASMRGTHLKAMTLRRQLTWRFPGVWQYWYLTADAAAHAGYCPEALRSMERAAQLHPGLNDTLRIERRIADLQCE